MARSNLLYGRKLSLYLVQGESVLDLSQFHFQFETKQEDQESPSNCAIRVFNLKPETERRVQEEYARVVLQAGYENGPFGVVFDGTIKQFRVGKSTPTETYLDILAADGDLAYNWTLVNQSLKAGSTNGDRIAAIVQEMQKHGVSMGRTSSGVELTGGILPRGKVLFGYGKTLMRSQVQSQYATWSIQNGKVNIVKLDEYLPGEAVIIGSATGMIGRAEQTEEGMRVRCLLNPKITVGGAIKLDELSVNQTRAQKDAALPGGAQIPYDKRAGVSLFANVAADGLYRVYVAEHTGDTRGLSWYTDIVGLTVDPTTNKVQPYG